MEKRTKTFKTREEYLKYRAEWKDAYKQLSAEIREAKNQRKQFKWEYRDKGMNAVKRKTKVGENPNYNPYANSHVQDLRYLARNMMEELAESKVKAAEQRNARLAQEELVA